VHPLAIGAYVVSEEDDMKRLSRTDALYIYGMGPLMNILFTLGILLVFATVFLALDMFGRARGAIAPWEVHVIPLIVVGLGMLMVTLWRYRRAVCTLVLLPIGWGVGTLIGHYVVTKSGIPAYGLSDGVGDIHRSGPALLKNWPPSAILEVMIAVLFGAGLSFLFGLTNLVPLVPFDGGHMMRFLLPVGLRDAYSYITVPVFAVLMLLQFGKDFYNLSHWIFTHLF
jgi:hypothetical protein